MGNINLSFPTKVKKQKTNKVVKKEEKIILTYHPSIPAQKEYYTYVDKDGNEVVEDTKGMRTKEYIIKRKLMLYIHKIKIQEI